MSDSDVFSLRIKLSRDKKGWSQAELARNAEITPAAVNQFEKGSRKPNMPILRKLAKVLDVSIDYLVGESDEENEVKSAEKITELIMENKKLREIYVESVAKECKCKKITEINKSFVDNWVKAREENKKLREALEFYAYPKHEDGDRAYIFGHEARKILAEIDEK